MEEEGGEEDAGQRNEWIKMDKAQNIGQFLRLKQGPTDRITERIDSNVQPSKNPTEADSVASTANTASIMTGKRKEGHRGEDNEGGMSVEDLQRGFISEVHSGDEREEERG